MSSESNGYEGSGQDPGYYPAEINDSYQPYGETRGPRWLPVFVGAAFVSLSLLYSCGPSGDRDASPATTATMEPVGSTPSLVETTSSETLLPTTPSSLIPVSPTEIAPTSSSTTTTVTVTTTEKAETPADDRPHITAEQLAAHQANVVKRDALKNSLARLEGERQQSAAELQKLGGLIIDQTRLNGMPPKTLLEQQAKLEQEINAMKSRAADMSMTLQDVQDEINKTCTGFRGVTPC